MYLSSPVWLKSWPISDSLLSPTVIYQPAIYLAVDKAIEMPTQQIRKRLRFLSPGRFISAGWFYPAQHFLIKRDKHLKF